MCKARDPKCVGLGKQWNGQRAVFPFRRGKRPTRWAQSCTMQHACNRRPSPTEPRKPTSGQDGKVSWPVNGGLSPGRVDSTRAQTLLSVATGTMNRTMTHPHRLHPASRMSHVSSLMHFTSHSSTCLHTPSSTEDCPRAPSPSTNVLQCYNSLKPVSTRTR